MLKVGLSLVCLLGCVSGFSSDVKTEVAQVVREPREIPAFEKLEIRGPMDIYLRQGDESRFEIEGSKADIAKVTTEVKEKTLMIDTTPRYNCDIEGPVKIYLVTSRLSSVIKGGSGDVIGEGAWKVEGLKVELNGSGGVMMDVQGERMSLALRGSGEMKFTGSLHKLHVMIDGSGSFDGKALLSDVASVQINGSGDATVHAKDALAAKVFGSGMVRYVGSPKVKSELRGSGTVEQLSGS